MMYRLIRFVLGLSLRGFFRTVSVQGIDRIPRSGPVLLISNHANAFVDPLLVLVSVQRRITLTAKSTLLGHPLLAPLIRAVGVVLLHRAQDVAHGAARAAYAKDRDPRLELVQVGDSEIDGHESIPVLIWADKTLFLKALRNG